MITDIEYPDFVTGKGCRFGRLLYRDAKVQLFYYKNNRPRIFFLTEFGNRFYKVFFSCKLTLK